MNWRKLLFWTKPTFKTPTFQELGRYDANDPAAGDAMVIAQLRKVGADLSQPREVLHYLYVPTEHAARETAAVLRAEGFSIEERPAADAGQRPANPWLVLAINQIVVDRESIALARRRLEELAAAAGGDYDGWEAAAKP